MDENNKEVKTTETKTVETVKKNPFKAVSAEEKVTTEVSTPEVEPVKKEEERIDVSRDLEEHLQENRDKVKYKINFKDVLAVIIMVIILIACTFLMYNFFTTHSYLFNEQTTTTTRGVYITTTTTEQHGVITIKTTSVKPAATHEVWVTSYVTHTKTTGLQTSIVGNVDDRTYTIKPGKTTARTQIVNDTTTTTTETTTTNVVEDESNTETEE